jgi:hypothetical protein
VILSSEKWIGDGRLEGLGLGFCVRVKGSKTNANMQNWALELGFGSGQMSGAPITPTHYAALELGFKSG